MSAAPPPPRPDGATAPQAVTLPDFSRRQAELREWMDEPCTYADWNAALRDIAQMNRLLRGAAPTLAFIDRVVRTRGVGYEPLHVVDVGCGDGEMLRRIARWAAKRSVPVRLTGVDMNPYAARAARERDREQRVSAKTVTWVTANALKVELEAPVDVVISSLFTHHLTDAEIVRFLRWMENTARWGWMIDDLRRSARSHRLFGWLARAMRWHRFVVHDGPVSIRRAFVAKDWEGMLRAAGITGMQVVERGVGRLCVERPRTERMEEQAGAGLSGRGVDERPNASARSAGRPPRRVARPA